MQTEIEVAKGFSLIVSSRKLPTQQDAYHLSLATRWEGAKNREETQEKYSVTLPREQMAKVAQAILQGLEEL